MMKNAGSVKPIFPALVCILALFAFSCKEEHRETPTQGNLTAISSEDLFPVTDIVVKDFMRVYPQAVVTHMSSSTRDAIVQLLNDSVRLIVSPREFNEEEQSVVANNELDVVETKIAYDAVAVIVNEKNALTRITVDELKKILTGGIQRWSQFKGSKLSSAVIVAMGEPNSGVHEYIKNRIAHNEPLAPIVFPCSTTSEVLSFVKDRPNAIGFVGIAWLANAPANVRVIEIGDPDFKSDSTRTELEYFAPHQAHIYRKFYPLSRTVYIYTHNAGRSVALGLTSFAAGSEGQKIIVKNGFVPATMPVRLVQLNNQ